MLGYGRVSLLVLALVALGGCSALSPITTALHLGEAADAVRADKEQPTTIKTVITKDNGEIVVRSDSSKSTVGTPIINPDNKPSFDTEKAVSSVPTWLYFIVGLSGILFLLNTVRHHYNKKKEVNYDPNRIDNNGWWRTHGRFVQIYGQRSKEQAEADGNDDGGSSAESGHRQSGERIRIQVGRRSCE